MEKILHGLEGVICFMDDVLVYGKDQNQHWERLRLVPERVRASAMVLEWEKFEFTPGSVKFLGHLVGGDGIPPDPDKVKAFREMEPPNNKKKARRFMGMVNYLSRFSANLAEVSVPIYTVTGKNSEWVMGLRSAGRERLVSVAAQISVF